VIETTSLILLLGRKENGREKEELWEKLFPSMHGGEACDAGVFGIAVTVVVVVWKKLFYKKYF
jgi:hypothetical protein